MIRGMDFPNDLETNVYQIVSLTALDLSFELTNLQDNIKEIHWAFYTWSQDEEEEVYEALQGTEILESVSIIRSVEYDLLEQGSHVLLDENEQGIWVFCLSEHEKEQTLQFLTSRDFDCMYHSCPRSTTDIKY